MFNKVTIVDNILTILKFTEKNLSVLTHMHNTYVR